MKKLSFFSVAVALVFMFSACDKSVPDQIVDEDLGVSGVKTYKWVDEGNKLVGYYYMYNQVSASDFAHFESGGTQFNNGGTKAKGWEIPGTEGKILLYRDGNGNGPVYIKFLEGAEALKAGDDYDCDYAIGVRFKASLNAVYMFNIDACVAYAINDGWMELDVKDHGPITQIRFGSEPLLECKKKAETVTIRFFRSRVIDCERVFDEDDEGNMIPFYVMTDFPVGGTFSHCLVWEAGANIDPELGQPYHFPPLRSNEIACDYTASAEAMAIFYGYYECFMNGVTPDHTWEATKGGEGKFIQGNSNIDWNILEPGFEITEDLDLLCKFDSCDPACIDVPPPSNKYVVTFNKYTSDDVILLCEDVVEEGDAASDECAQSILNGLLGECEKFLGWLDENGTSHDIQNVMSNLVLYADIDVFVADFDDLQQAIYEAEILKNYNPCFTAANALITAAEDLIDGDSCDQDAVDALTQSINKAIDDFDGCPPVIVTGFSACNWTGEGTGNSGNTTIRFTFGTDDRSETIYVRCTAGTQTFFQTDDSKPYYIEVVLTKEEKICGENPGIKSITVIPK